MTAVSNDDLKYWVAFSRINRVGNVRVGQLEAHFASLAAAWEAPSVELTRAGFDRGTVQSIVSARTTISPDEELRLLERAGVRAFNWHDDAYPARLKQTDDRPPVLYVKGELRPEDELAVAIVGTRGATPYGRQVAEEFATDLARSGITVVSGLARGIDGVAHRAALAAGGRTIAVLASGLDIIYPGEHTGLAREIIEHGALVSDYPVGTKPRSEYFPRRNRILSGLSLGVLVAEAPTESGALITARRALDQNREVFAVPGSIYAPSYRGANKLIRDGEARLVTKAEDILEELHLTVTATIHQMELREVLPADPTEAGVLQLLSNEPVHIDDVQRTTGFSVGDVASALAMLELKGLVRQVGAMSFVRARDPGTIHYK